MGISRTIRKDKDIANKLNDTFVSISAAQELISNLYFKLRKRGNKQKEKVVKYINKFNNSNSGFDGFDGKYIQKFVRIW